MKRDMELVKLLLEDIEKNCSYNSDYRIQPDTFNGYAVEEVNGHIALVLERGLIEATKVGSGYSVRRLTWSGHDFLDNARNSTVWQATVRSAGKLSFAVFTEVLTEAAKAFALNQLKSFF